MKNAAVFAALGDDTRLRIVAKLSKEGPLSIARLTGATDVSRQAVTKHLHALSKAGLIRSERAGRERIYKLQPARLAEVRQYLSEISQQWDEAIVRLRAFVED